MKEFEIVKSDINRIGLGKSMKVEHYDRTSGDIVYMFRVTGFISLRSGVNIVDKHVPSWFTFEHLEFLVNSDTNSRGEKTSDGHTYLELSKLIYESAIKERKESRPNVTFTRPGEYTYTYEKTTI